MPLAEMHPEIITESPLCFSDGRRHSLFHLSPDEDDVWVSIVISVSCQTAVCDGSCVAEAQHHSGGGIVAKIHLLDSYCLLALHQSKDLCATKI